MERKGQRKKGSGARERGSQIDGTERKEMKKKVGAYSIETPPFQRAVNDAKKKLERLNFKTRSTAKLER